MQIRTETPRDRAAVRALNAGVFEREAEAVLVDRLRDQTRPVVSLVAAQGWEIIGHILFSPVSLEGHATARLMGLAPMGVVKAHQRQGIGSALVQAGLARCRLMRVGAVVVLGHPDFYPRFGFVPASRFGIGCEYDVPEEAFMIIELQPGYLGGRTGIISYHCAFRQL